MMNSDCQPPVDECSSGPEIITIQTADGRTMYWPPGDMARLAPAAVCAVASRILRLRQKLDTFEPEVRARLEQYVTPLPFEEYLLSGRIAQVHGAIRALGARGLPPENPRVTLHVEAGVLQAADTNVPGLSVELWDFDNLGGNGFGLDDDFVEEKYLEAIADLGDCPIKAPNEDELFEQEKAWKHSSETN